MMLPTQRWRSRRHPPQGAPSHEPAASDHHPPSHHDGVRASLFPLPLVTGPAPRAALVTVPGEALFPLPFPPAPRAALAGGAGDLPLRLPLPLAGGLGDGRSAGDGLSFRQLGQERRSHIGMLQRPFIARGINAERSGSQGNKIGIHVEGCEVGLITAEDSLIHRALQVLELLLAFLCVVVVFAATTPPVPQCSPRTEWRPPKQAS